MHDDIVGTDLLGVLRQVDHDIHVLVGAGHDRLGPARAGIHRQFEAALALLQRHGEELALLAGYEEAVDAEIVDPVVDVAAKAVLIDCEILLERHEPGSPDALHGLPRIGLGVFFRVLHA